jgi:peptidoglycan/LPS O-acetylase OafA/YrhL
MAQKTASDNLPVGYLRAFLTLLVVAHHSALCYMPEAPPIAVSMLSGPKWWGAFPVVDSNRWEGFSILVGFDDAFFMSAMFLLSGLFVWKSLQRKGPGQFLRDRFLRLGVPFVLAALFIAPLCYYPAYLQMRMTYGPGPEPLSYWQTWFSLGIWPAGPAWFLWVLLAYDCAAATLFALVPDAVTRLGAKIASIDRPIVLFAGLATVSAVAYIPMVEHYGPIYTYVHGPFAAQASRVFHYFVYFLAGLLIGMSGIDASLFRAGGRLSRRWLPWTAAAAVIGAIMLEVYVAMMAHPFSHLYRLVWGFAFTLSCAASTFAAIACFEHLVKHSRPVLDSLRDNAYGIYLVHIAFVTWLQYAMLTLPLPAVVKGLTVMILATLLSWGTTLALRRIPAVARII